MMARHCSHCFSNGAIYLQKMYKVRKFEGFEGFERFEKFERFERLLPSVRASRARSEGFRWVVYCVMIGQTGCEKGELPFRGAKI